MYWGSSSFERDLNDLRVDMSHYITFIEIDLALRVQSSIVNWIIITLAQEQCLFLFLLALRCFRLRVPDLLYSANPMNNGDLLIFNLIHDYISDFDCGSLN